MFTGFERAGRVKISTSDASISARLLEEQKLHQLKQGGKEIFIYKIDLP